MFKPKVGKSLYNVTHVAEKKKDIRHLLYRNLKKIKLKCFILK